MLEIELPYPVRQLHPNTRRGSARLQRASAVKDARAQAKLVTLTVASEGRGHLLDCHLPTFPVVWIFYPPDRRRRDLGGVYAACKAFEDGLADALGVDDSRFRPVTLDWGEPYPRGKVVVKIGE